MRGIVLAPWALVLAAACGRGGEVSGASRPAGFPGIPLPALAAANEAGGQPERLLGYRWEGHGTVPWPFDETPRSLPFGPVGRTPSTLLYLTFDGPPQREAAGQEPRWRLEPPEDARAPSAEGRFGGGLVLAAGERLSLRRDEPAAPAALTIEFWIRPEHLRQGPILSLPGLLELHCQAKGGLRLELRSGDSATLSAPAALAAGRWSHVGIVVDPQQLRVARLVLDEHARATELAAADPLPPVQRVDLGGGPLGFRVDELRVSARAANTSELIETWEARAQPLERLELATSGGARSLEVWTAFLSEPVVEEAAQWARGELENAVADADGLRWVPGHWRRIRALDPPLARTCHPTVYLGDGRLFVYSGEVRDSHVWPMQNPQDTWLYHTRAERWERLMTPLAPPGRCHQQAAYSPEHDLVLLPAGWTNGGGLDVKLDDTWVFHVGEGRWEQRNPSGSGVFRGGENALVYHPRLGRFLMFKHSTVAAYDPARDSWAARRARVTDEQGRPSDYLVPHSMTAAHDPLGDHVVLFGGARGDPEPEFCNGTLLYERRANRLVVLDLPESPAPRVRPGFAYDQRRARIVMFGGVRDQFSQRMDDLWSFDPAQRRWTRHEASGTPSPRGGYMHMAYDPELDRFFLVCGRHAPERFLEEVWSLTLDEHAVGRARFAFDRAGFGAERAWFWEGTAPGDSALEFRFRASVDGLAWGEWSPLASAAERYLEVEVTLRPGSAGERPVLRSMGFGTRT